MKVKKITKTRVALSDDSFVDLLVWQVPKLLKGSNHSFKYRLAYVVDNECVLRYDNESGKGDHKHIGDEESPYIFTTPKQLFADFWKDVKRLEVGS